VDAASLDPEPTDAQHGLGKPLLGRAPVYQRRRGVLDKAVGRLVIGP
jgi:hypothetical protein